MSKSLKETLGPLKIGGPYSNFKLNREIEKRNEVELLTGKPQETARLNAIIKLIETLQRYLK